MQQPEQQPGGYLRLNVGATALAGAVTAIILAIVSLPLHLLHRTMFGATRGMMFPGGGAIHPAMGAGSAAWILLGCLVVLVYAGVAGALFAIIYNAMLTRR